MPLCYSRQLDSVRQFTREPADVFCPKFREMMRDAQAGRCEVLIVHKLDRLSRYRLSHTSRVSPANGDPVLQNGRQRAQ